jgi:hypothetical protein
VFGGYADQLRSFHEQSGRASATGRVRTEFDPDNLGEWMYRQVSDWSKAHGRRAAYLHVFRKTTLQYARSGEDVNRIVANDARITEGVMMRSYARETDEELR